MIDASECKTVRRLANSGYLRQILEDANVCEKVRNSVIDRCLR